MQIDQKTRKKALLLLIIIIIAMLIPMKYSFKDGGTVQYKAVLYSVTNYHALETKDYHTGYRIGREVKILFWKIYDDSKFVPDNIEHILSPAE